MTHTPEPWKVYNAYGGDFIKFLRIGNDEATVIKSTQYDTDIEGKIDDIRLIVASPLLLDALKVLIGLVQHNIATADDLWEVHDAQAAIRAAEGEE